MPVEYAIEAMSHAGAAVGLRTNEGVVLAAEHAVEMPQDEPTFSRDLTCSSIAWPSFRLLASGCATGPAALLNGRSSSSE